MGWRRLIWRVAVESTWRIVPPAMSGFIPVKLIRSFGVG